MIDGNFYQNEGDICFLCLFAGKLSLIRLPIHVIICVLFTYFEGRSALDLTVVLQAGFQARIFPILP